MPRTNPFMPRFEALPTTIALFPLPGAIVLPGCDLNLNIFEPRYLTMINDALKSHRLIAMVQPREQAPDVDIGTQPVHATACAARVTSFQETTDGRILITLTGVCRFTISDEHDSGNGYRIATADWSNWKLDMYPEDEEIDVEALMKSIKAYLGDNDMQANIESLKKLAPDMLVNTLAMHMPFSPFDKQALVDARSVAERATLLGALCEFGGLQSDDDSSTRH